MHGIIKELESIFAPGRRAFSLIVLAYLGWLALINALMFLPALGWLPDNALSAMGHFGKFLGAGDTHDLIHEFVFALIIGTAAVGLFSQLWKPKENFAGQLIALIAWVAMILTATFTNNWVPQPLFIIFGGLTLLATILHPAGRGLFNWFSVARLRQGYGGQAKINRVLLTLVIISAIPLLALAFANIGLQTAGGGTTGFFAHMNDTTGMTTDDEAHEQKHAALGHYRNIAALSFTITLVGILASFRPPGWRLAAWVAGFLPILLGFVSLVLPDAESNFGTIWGLAAIAWGVAFVAAAEYCNFPDGSCGNRIRMIR